MTPGGGVSAAKKMIIMMQMEREEITVSCERNGIMNTFHNNNNKTDLGQGDFSLS